MLFALVCQGCCGSYGICGFLDMARQISRRQYKYGTDIHSTDIHSRDSKDTAQKILRSMFKKNNDERKLGRFSVKVHHD